MDMVNKNSYPDALEDIPRTFGPKDPRPCRKCGEMWTPGDWNFYDLCDKCFAAFNSQKMAGRMSGGTDYFESATKWTEASKGSDDGISQP